jgi:hypothetical protein
MLLVQLHNFIGHTIEFTISPFSAMLLTKESRNVTQMSAVGGFMNYAGGVYNSPDCSLGPINHAMVRL